MTLVGESILALALLYVGGEAVIRGASALAAAAGVSPLAIGLTVVAFGTSAPELVVSLRSVLAGANDIALGNVVGSNIANVALILGLAALIRPVEVHAKVIRIDLPLLVFVSGALLLVLADGFVAHIEAVVLLSGLVAYTAFTFWEATRETSKVQAEFERAATISGRGALVSALSLLVGLGLLVAGGGLLVRSAVTVASTVGVSEAVIGLTIVAVGTSLPEAVATVLASVRGYGDVAVGNVVGSNLFNILGIVGITSLVRPLSTGAITWSDLWIMALITVPLALLLPLRSRLGRLEGAVMVAGFVAYTVWRVG